ncbi:hypothetical protein JCM10207_008631 [Rhodosporidiobolus poonsookiae]
MPPPTLLDLPAEILDSILLLVLPTSPRRARLALSVLLSVHPSLTTLVRRRIYEKVTFIVGDPKGRDRRLLDNAESPSGAGGEGGSTQKNGAFVRYLKIRAPDPELAGKFPDKAAQGNEDCDHADSSPADGDAAPAAALVPRPFMRQCATVPWVARFVRTASEVKHVEWNLRVGALFERPNGTVPLSIDEAREFGGEAALGALQAALEKWRNVQTLLVALEDATQRLQVLACPGRPAAPLLAALATWTNLTALDLWRVRLELPPASSPDSLPEPPFRLKLLAVTQSKLGSARELEWLAGSPTSPTRGRTNRLETLILDDLSFTSTPGSTAPLRDFLFAAAGPPPFAGTVRDLTLILREPLGPSPSPSLDTDADADAHLLSGLTALRTAELGGPGLPLAVYLSLFLPPASSTRAARQSPPSHTLKSLTLTYLTHPSVSLPALLAPFTARPTSLPKLVQLVMTTTFPLPRELGWSARRAAPEPRWAPLAAAAGADSDDEDEREAEEEGAWAKVVQACRAVSLARVAAGTPDGEEEDVERRRVRLFKNRGEVQYSVRGSRGVGEGDSDEWDSEEEEDEDEEEAEEGADEMDMNALFVPSEGEDLDAEREAEIRTRILLEEEEEEDF